MPKKGKKSLFAKKRWVNTSKMHDLPDDLSEMPTFDVANTHSEELKQEFVLAENGNSITSDKERYEINMHEDLQKSESDVEDGNRQCDIEINKQSTNQNDTCYTQHKPMYNEYSNEGSVESTSERSKEEGHSVSKSKAPTVDKVQETVYASFSQSDMRFSDISRGRQCTCNALILLLYSLQESNFTTNLLDEILAKGDELYHNVVYDLIRTDKFIAYLLQFEELPSTVQLNSQRYTISKRNVFLGTIIEMPNLPFSQTLHTAISAMLQETSMGLIIAGAICSAIFRDVEGRLVFFDSHSHGRDMLSCSEGTAMLKYFSSIDDLLTYLYAFYDSQGIELDLQFEVQPITVEITNSHPVEQLSRTNNEDLVKLSKYLKYQKDMADKKSGMHSETRIDDTQSGKQEQRDYNRQYKRKQRLTTAFRDKENVKEIYSKLNCLKCGPLVCENDLQIC